ncbi:TPA: hypothetical protein ACH3X1_008032 [Trebouxia sp. C0004]
MQCSYLTRLCVASKALVVEVEGSITTELAHLHHHHRFLLHAPGPFKRPSAEAQAV